MGRVGSGVWFPHGNSMCGVCVREWCGLRIELEVEVAPQQVHLCGVQQVHVFAEWSGCSVVLCLVLVLRCARVVVYVIGC